MGALDNIRVVDFGHYVAGPVVGMLLADQGADVVKVDRPGGPAMESEANATWNRNTRRITLDLKNPDDHRTAMALIRRADVVIENFRPGVMDRLGLGEAELRAHNRGLIYNAIPGFGREDARSAMPAWEGTILAATDVFRPASSHRDTMQQLHLRPADRDGDPLYTAEPMASLFAAMLSSTGIAAALRVRRETGAGQRVEVPLFDAMLQGAGVYGMARLPFRPTYLPATNPWDHQYRCADDRWIHLACHNTHHAEQLAEVLDRPDLIERGLTSRSLQASAHHELILFLNETMATRTAEEWEQLLMAHELPGAMCRTPAEWLKHPQTSNGGLLIDVDDPILGPTRQPAPVVQLAAAPTSAPTPASRPDGDRDAIVSELAEEPTKATSTSDSNDELSGLISRVEGPLQGIRVLDIGLALAGPSCGRTLAELGADVIKIDSPHRGSGAYHHCVNRGKRSLLLDLEHDEGHDLFWELAQTADVIVENFRPGVAEDLAVDYDLMVSERPEIIYVSITAYGEEGPLAELPGFAETTQASTGLQVRYGGSDQPAVWPYGEVDDYATGHAAAFGVVLALLQRDETGTGQRITTDLARSAGLLQSAHLIDHVDKVWDEPSGLGSLGSSDLQRLYRCEDGWIFLGAKDASDLDPVLGHEGAGQDLGARVEAWCLDRSAEDAVEELVKHGLGAQELGWLNAVMSDPVVVRRGLSVIRDHGSIGLLRTSGPGPWFSHSRVDAGNPAPLPGSDAASILADIDRGEDLDRLVEAGIIKLPSQS
ncbi:MAG: CoA transferase [Actinomycetota bacterium]